MKRDVKGNIEKSTGEAIFEGINFDNLNFVFAKTMSEMPHYYVKRSVENEKDYVACSIDLESRPRSDINIDTGIAATATNTGQ